MEYYGESVKLTKILNDRRRLIKEFGQNRALKIMDRLGDFELAETLNDISYLPPQRLHLLHGDRDGQFAVDISANYRMIFEAYTSEEVMTTNKDEAVIISIVAIEDYH